MSMDDYIPVYESEYDEQEKIEDLIKQGTIKTSEDILKTSMHLDDEILQSFLTAIKAKIDAVSNELLEAGIDNIRLEDLRDYEKLKYTIRLSYDIKECFELLSYIMEYYDDLKGIKRLKLDAIAEDVAKINSVTKSYDFKCLTSTDTDEGLLRQFNYLPYNQGEKDHIVFLHTIARERTKRIVDIQIEYSGKDIIIVDTFIDELYHELYNTYGFDDDAIIEMLTHKNIKPYYDSSLAFLKIELIDVLNDNNDQIKKLHSKIETAYKWILNTLLDAIEAAIKNDNE